MTTIGWTEFASVKADAVWNRTGTWPQLIERIRTAQGYASKDACPLLKLATFGNVRSSKGGSLRHDANVMQITGIEGDYDGEQVQPLEALEMLERAAIRAAIYTSARHTPERPRWRVLAPCSRPLQPADRRALLARLNGALGGLLAAESFTLSQAYYFGGVDGAPDYHVRVTFDDPEDGHCIDELDNLDAIAIDKPTLPPSSGNDGAQPGEDVFADAVRARGRPLRTGDGRRELLKGYIASLSARRWRPGEVELLIDGIAARYFDPADPIDAANVAELIEWAARRDEDALQQNDTPADHDDPAAPLFVVVPVDDLEARPPEPPAVWWGGYLPAGVVTLLGAHGGAGKSTVALMLSVSVAMGLPLFGVPTRRGTVGFYSGEDPADLLRHRLAWVCRVLGVDPSELAGRLHLLDATGNDPTLFHEVGSGRRIGKTTPAYTELCEYVTRHALDVLIVDNASDAFDASEIDRARVRAFMRSLARIAQARGGAVLLLAHVDKGTSRGERPGSEGYSGSTAWHNSARSRLYLSRDKDGALLLEHQKHNLTEQMPTLRLLWPKGGLPTLEAQTGGLLAAIDDRNHTRALLKLIHEFTGRGEFIAPAKSSPLNAVQLMGSQPTFPRVKPAEVFDLLRDAERAGLLQRATYRTADRKERERWALTAAGCDLIGAPAPTAPTAPTFEDGAPSAAGANGAPTAPTVRVGGVGGRSARTETVIGGAT